MQRIGKALLRHRTQAMLGEEMVKDKEVEKDIADLKGRDLLSVLVQANLDFDVPDSQREDVLARTRPIPRIISAVTHVLNYRDSDILGSRTRNDQHPDDVGFVLTFTASQGPAEAPRRATRRLYGHTYHGRTRRLAVSRCGDQGDFARTCGCAGHRACRGERRCNTRLGALRRQKGPGSEGDQVRAYTFLSLQSILKPTLVRLV